MQRTLSTASLEGRQKLTVEFGSISNESKVFSLVSSMRTVDSRGPMRTVRGKRSRRLTKSM